MKSTCVTVLLAVGLFTGLLAGCENLGQMTDGSESSDEIPVETNTNATADVTATNRPTPMEVWVDDDYNENTPGWGYDHFNTIFAGAHAVSTNGGQIIIYAGVYHEDMAGPAGTGFYPQGDTYATPDAIIVSSKHRFGR